MNRTRAIFVALCTSLVLVFSTASPTLADPHGHWLNNSMIDDDGDARYDLTICFGLNGQALHTNRGDIANFLYWQVSRYVVGDGNVAGAAYDRGFKSNGACDNDGSEVQIVMKNLGACGNPAIAATQELDGDVPAPIGHNILVIALNSNCAFDWNGPVGGVNGWSANSVVLHEFGHVWGFGHAGTPANALMDEGGPDNCNLNGNQYTFAADDVMELRAKYGGIADTANGVQVSCLG